MKKFYLTPLALAISALTFAMPSYASDIEIYKVPDKTQKTVVMMLDTSSSMLLCDTPAFTLNLYNPTSWWPASRHKESITYTNFYSTVHYNDWYADSRNRPYKDNPTTLNKYVGSEQPTASKPYQRNYCLTPETGGQKYYDRATKLKDAMYELMDNPDLDESIHLAIGVFNNKNSNSRNTSGIMAIEAQPLTPSHKQRIKDYVAQLKFEVATPSASAYAEAAAYMLGTTTKNTGENHISLHFSGFRASEQSTKKSDGQTYQSPLPTTNQQCSGQAIYFLTDGYPNRANKPQLLMKSALGNSSSFPDKDFYTVPQGSQTLTSTAEEGMAQIAMFSQFLRDPKKNPKNVEIKTTIVGFGAGFKEAESNKIILPYEGGHREFYDCAKIRKREIKNTCNWGAKSHPRLPGVGGFGEGGFYYAEDSNGVVDSFVNMVKDIKIDFQPITTGSPTIPADNLNRQNILPQAYYTSFQPRPDSLQQLWVGNMSRYDIDNGQLIGKNSRKLFNSNSKLIDSNTIDLWGRNTNSQGVIGQLKLQHNSNNKFQRKLYTNRKIQNTHKGENDTQLHEVSFQALSSGMFKNDPAITNWLNLLGYNTNSNVIPNNPTPELRQMGAVLHSKPVLLTQGENIKNGNKIREDYLLFGSTQGLLHIIDTKTGEEKFAFAPHEMVEKQKEAFLPENSTNGGKNRLFYGIDGPWVSHTQYVSKLDGTLTVNQSDISYNNTNAMPIHLRGLQWVYGGLRMGGKSYYGLDLSDIDNPKFKFQIDPENQKIHSTNTSVTAKTYPELKFMGQSWSKPTIGYVLWDKADKTGKERRLVMFVGGGYDIEYEKSDYRQSNGNGAGVYMFDANTGELLWWASNNQATNGVAQKHIGKDDDTDSLKYSVVSRIQTIDNNSDGLVDHLYFGDLSGQAFRIDLDNQQSNEQFSKRVIKLLDEHRDDGLSPRFYELPSVSLHKYDDASGMFAVVALGSGDRSSPLAGPRKDAFGKDIVTNNTTATDGIFVIYDHDITRANLRTSDIRTRSSSNKKLQLLDVNVGVKPKEGNNYKLGWKYYYGGQMGDIKSFDEPYTITNLLFINTYDKNAIGIQGQCGGGIIGSSKPYQFCLPTGKCDDNHGLVTKDNMILQNSAPGLVGTTLGGSGTTLVNITPGGKTSNPNKKQKGDINNFTAEAPASLRQLRWYESRLGG